MEIRVGIKTEVSTVVEREETALEVSSGGLLIYVRLAQVPTSGALLPLRNSRIIHTISFKNTKQQYIRTAVFAFKFPVCLPTPVRGSLHRHIPTGCPPARRKQVLSP